MTSEKQTLSTIRNNILKAQVSNWPAPLKRRLIQWLIRLVITLLLLLFIWKLNLNLGLIYSSIIQINLGLLMVSIIIIGPILVIKSWRWQVILRGFNIELRVEP